MTPLQPTHTPGPWMALNHQGVFVLAEGGLTVAGVTYQLPDVNGETRRLANARLIASAPELLAEVEREYIELADIRNEWSGRHTLAGQHRLCALRDLICKATGREPQDVQDDYGNRLLHQARSAS